MTPYTPGPWSVEEYGDAPALAIHKDSETRVCFMATPGSHGDPAKIEADARLIAAAPDMLEALKGLMPVLNTVQLATGLSKSQVAQIKLARKAIAKATGGGALSQKKPPLLRG